MQHALACQPVEALWQGQALQPPPALKALQASHLGGCSSAKQQGAWPKAPAPLALVAISVGAQESGASFSLASAQEGKLEGIKLKKAFGGSHSFAAGATKSAKPKPASSEASAGMGGGAARHGAFSG